MIIQYFCMLHKKALGNISMSAGYFKGVLCYYVYGKDNIPLLLLVHGGGLRLPDYWVFPQLTRNPMQAETKSRS